MKFLSDNELLQDSRILIAIAVSSLVVIGLVFFNALFISALELVVTSVIGVTIPVPWAYLEPAMPYLNIGFYIVGAAAIALIGREYIFTERYIYFAVTSYLLFYPLAGMNWSTFSTLSLFPPLFLMGFYLYKIELRWASGLFFIAAAATFQVYLLLVIIAGLAMLSGDRKHGTLARENYLAISIISISLFMLITEAFHSGFMGYYGIISINGYGPVLGLIQTLTYAKPLFFIVLFVPIITFAFFGPRMLPVTLPYYIFGIITTVAGGSPETLVAILDLIMPLAFLGTLKWIGRRVEIGIPANETRIIRYTLFSLILMNILVVVTYFPFLKILASLLGL